MGCLAFTTKAAAEEFAAAAQKLGYFTEIGESGICWVVVINVNNE